MAFAIIETGGKQLRVKKNDRVRVERLQAAVKKDVRIDRVLMVSDGKKVELGRPYIKGAHVMCEVMGHERGDKVVAYKYKKRKSSKFKRGHRQELTSLRVKDIHGGVRGGTDGA